MIDPHVHARDWNQSPKETLAHALAVAQKIGLDAFFEMPNTDPPLTTREAVEKRMATADKALRELKAEVFHGIYVGIVSDPKEEQLEDAIELWDNYFPRVVGLKMFAGHSTGNLGIVTKEEQNQVYKDLADLGYKGVLVVHCEKEQLLKSELWDSKQPLTHTKARPPESEVESVKDQIHLAHTNNYAGTLHIAHVSVPETYQVIKN